MFKAVIFVISDYCELDMGCIMPYNAIAWYTDKQFGDEPSIDLVFLSTSVCKDPHDNI